MWICAHRCVSLQGLRIGGALSLSQARKVNVEPGCSVPDPCSSNPCPANSYCRDDWDTHSCTCLAGQSIRANEKTLSCGSDTKPYGVVFGVDTPDFCFHGNVVQPCFALFDRFLWQQLHRRLLAEPLRARVSMHEEAELHARLHL